MYEGDETKRDGDTMMTARGRLDETVQVPEIERELQHVEAAAELLQQLVESARIRFAGVLDENSDRASALTELAERAPQTHVGGRLSETGRRMHDTARRLSELIDRCQL